TVVDSGPDPNNKYITTYFRRSFNVASTSEAADLTLHLKRDDGAIVYINGVEVARSNMPSGPVDGSTLASSSVVHSDESRFFTIGLAPGALVDGDNVIAVEIHQASPSSSDISFDLGLDLTTSNAPPITLEKTSQLTARAYQDGAWSPVESAQF